MVKEYRMSKARLTFLNNSKQPYPAWSMSLLKDAVEINPKTESLPNQFVYIDLEAVQRGTLISTKIYKKQDAPSRAQRLLKANDVLFQMVRPYQKNNYFFKLEGSLPAVSSTGYAQLRAKNNCQKFIYYTLHTEKFVRNVLDRCTGGTYPAINSSDLGEIVINIPCKEEQQKIAAFFTALDEKIDLVEKELSLTEKISSVVFEQIYRGDLQLNKLDGSPFPVWQIRKLDQLLDFQNGINASKEQFGSGIKLISVKEVLSKTPVTYDSIESSINVDEKLAKRFSVEYGDVIFQRSSETAEEAGSANVYLDSRPSVFGGFVIRGKQKADYHPQFMKMALRSPKVRRQIVRLAQGAQHVNIGQEQLSSVEIKFPCLEEQKKIAELISDFEHKELVLVQKLDALKRLKQAFMQQMFI